MDLIRTIFFFIDNIIYEFVGVVYELLMEIANTTIFTEEIIDLFASKVYALLGIFMLFKVSFSILTYIVNPDEFTDKSKGFSKLITNIIITLTLLIFTPWIFSQAMDIQRIVLKDNVIGKIFSTSASLTFLDGNDNTGANLAYRTFKAFYKIDNDNFSSCVDVDVNSNNDQACKTFLGFNEDKYNKYIGTLKMAAETEKVEDLENDKLLNYQKDDKYLMSYTPIISTAVGGFMIWIFIIFCFDIAVRSVKLGFLRVIAPIPIVSRIDPKGKGMFDRWVKNCISTYLDLFIRLLAIFFAIFIIEQVFNMDFVSQTTGLPTDVEFFTKIFIIMGALLFAKQLPKLLSDLTGAKLDGKFTLNPLKKMSEVPLIGKPMAAGTQFAARTAGNVAGAIGHMAFNPLRNAMGSSDFGKKIGERYKSMSAKFKSGYNEVNRATGGRLGNIVNDFDSTIGSIGRSIEDDLGVFERRDRFLSNREAEILNNQSAYKEIMQKNKTMTAAVDAVFDRAKKKLSESEDYAKRKADVERLKSLADSASDSIGSRIRDLNAEKVGFQNNLNEYMRQLSSTTDNVLKEKLKSQIKDEEQKINRITNSIEQSNAELKVFYDEYATAEAGFNTWANKGGVFEYIDKTTDDDVLNGLIAKRDETARALSDAQHDYVSQFVGKTAKDNDTYAGKLKAENTEIESSFVAYEQELYEIKEQKRQLQEARRSVGDYRRIGAGPKNK